MRDFVFSTDWHVSTTNNVRTGDILGDLIVKIRFIVDYCNRNDCQLLVGGDVFDKSSVPDIAKNELIEVLRKLKKKAIVIEGNHDRRYNNEEFIGHTSLGTLVSAGVVELLTTIDYPEVQLTSVKPMKTIGKPQIGMFHGFLNQEDGKNTVYFQDILITDRALVLLGHDHVEYEDTEIGSVTVIRPGSLIRGTRQDTNLRQPKLVRIRIKDNGTFVTKDVPITTARDCEEIFKTKKVTLGKAEKTQHYDKIIDQIRNAKSGDISLMEGLRLVTSEEVCNFIQDLVDDKALKSTK